MGDAEGAVLVHGLLTATLPTKLGGDLDYLARSMHVEFPRPVVTGQAVTCELTVEFLEVREDRYALAAGFECATPDGTVVRRGDSEGVVFKDR